MENALASIGLILAHSCLPSHASLPSSSFPLMPPSTGDPRREGLNEWAWKLRYRFKKYNRITTSSGQLVGIALLLVYLWVNSASLGLSKDAWLNLKGKGFVKALHPEKTDFLCLIGVFNIHTQSKTVRCAHPPRRLHHFSEHIEYTTPFQHKNNRNNKAEVQNPDCWVVCV